MRIKNAKTFLAGAVAGVGLLIACGSDSVINAIDVLFDNTDTNLAATNVQDAIKEVAPPKVVDADGNELGLLLDRGWASNPSQFGVYNKTLNSTFLIQADGTGFSILYFASTDCSGQAYSKTAAFTTFLGTKVYTSSTTGVSETIQSWIDGNGTCTPDTPGYNPIFAATEVATAPFPLPIAGPIQIVP